MIQKLIPSDIEEVVKIHKQELPGFLSELGERFLQKFYTISLHTPELETFVEKENEQILGFVTIAYRTKRLYKRIISQDILGISSIFLKYFIVHPEKIIPSLQLVAYPGFSEDIPELLTIAIDKLYQKRGIGNNLFQKIIAECKKKGIMQFRVSVYGRLPANAFYKKMGCTLETPFSFLGEKMNYYKYKVE